MGVWITIYGLNLEVRCYVYGIPRFNIPPLSAGKWQYYVFPPTSSASSFASSVTLAILAIYSSRSCVWGDQECGLRVLRAFLPLLQCMNGLLPLPRLKPRWQHRKAKAEEEASFDSCSDFMAHHEINSLSLCLNRNKTI